MDTAPAPVAADPRRMALANAQLRLDFDLRTSDTMYNFVWLRNPRTGAFERLYNFGTDVGARSRDGQIHNTIGVGLRAERTGAAAVRLTYPAPLVEYRQFERAASPDAIHRYPDLPSPLPPALRVADASVAVEYALCGDEAAFTVSGVALGGVVANLTAIVNAMWVDNEHVPTRTHLDGIGDFAWDREQPLNAAYMRDLRYALFWDPRGAGVPFALIPHARSRHHVAPYTNPDGEGVFQACSTNQAFRPRRAPTTGINDVNCYLPLGEARRSTELRFAFLPELAWGQGGDGDALLERLRARVLERHCGWWAGMTRHPRVELDLRTWPDARRPPATAPGIA